LGAAKSPCEERAAGNGSESNENSEEDVKAGKLICTSLERKGGEICYPITNNKMHLSREMPSTRKKTLHSLTGYKKKRSDRFGTELKGKS